MHRWGGFRRKKRERDSDSPGQKRRSWRKQEQGPIGRRFRCDSYRKQHLFFRSERTKEEQAKTKDAKKSLGGSFGAGRGGRSARTRGICCEHTYRAPVLAWHGWGWEHGILSLAGWLLRLRAVRARGELIADALAGRFARSCRARGIDSQKDVAGSGDVFFPQSHGNETPYIFHVDESHTH